MGVTGRDLRVVDGAYTADPDAPVGPPELDAWVRFRDVPDDPAAARRRSSPSSPGTSRSPPRCGPTPASAR